MAYSIDVLGTGSSGNSIFVDDNFLIDIGLGYRTIKDALATTSAIFVTHRHGDHLTPSLVKRMFEERPFMMERNFFINEDSRQYLIKKLPQHENRLKNLDVIHPNGWTHTLKTRNDKTYYIETYPLVHDVENQGFIIENEQGDTLIHATDTSTMKYAPNRIFDYLLVEGNWDEDKFDEMIESHNENDVMRALRNTRHLSVQAFEKFVRAHSHDSSIVLQLHESMELGSRSLMGMNFDEARLKRKITK